MVHNRKAAIGFIFITLLIDITGLGLIIPVFPKLITELIHSNLSVASQWGGMLTFAYALMQFLCAPIVGNLSDQYGRRPVLLLSLLGFGIDYLFLAFAPTIGWLFLSALRAYYKYRPDAQKWNQAIMHRRASGCSVLIILPLPLRFLPG